MFVWEKRIAAFVEKYAGKIFWTITLVISLAVRFQGRNFISGDMKNCLYPWFERISQDGGISALKNQVGNYSLLYQTIIAFLTYTDGFSLYLYKMVSVLFDYCLAFAVAGFGCELVGHRSRKLFMVITILVLYMPTVILNSSYWGQCDSIFTFFVMLTLFYMYQERYVGAFIFYGIAFALKFQAIFILPFVILHYFYKKKYSLLNLGISVCVFWLSGILAYVQGRSILAPFQIYLEQSQAYPKMYLNVNSFWVLLGSDYSFAPVAFGITLCILGFAMWAILDHKLLLKTSEEYMGILCWTVWTLILFLPAMHERYTYLLDILLLLLALTQIKYAKYAIGSLILSLMTYGNYLTEVGTVHQWSALLYAAMWLCFTGNYVKEHWKGRRCWNENRN